MNMYKFIFVCGAGRSGTHFVGDLLNTSDKVKLVDENGQVYVWLKRAAMSRFPLLSRIYAIGAGTLAMFIGISNYGKIVVFKSHPSIWSYEVLNRIIPNAGFFIVKRSPQGMVSSMFRHEGVKSWYKLKGIYSGRRKMLGISARNRHEFDSYSPLLKFVVKWYVHDKRATEIAMYSNVHVCQYDNLAIEEEYRRIKEFVGFEVDSSIFKKETTSKWKSLLTENQVIEIDNIIKNIHVYL